MIIAAAERETHSRRSQGIASRSKAIIPRAIRLEIGRERVFRGVVRPENILQQIWGANQLSSSDLS